MTRRFQFRPFSQPLHAKWLMIAAVLLFFFLAVSSMVNDSPTMDEQNHLARGLAFLKTGDPRLSLEHPPLINSLSALPVLTLPNIRLPTDHPSWNLPQGWYAFAEQLLWVYNHDVTRMIFLARLPIIFLTIGLALTGFHFAHQVWGRSSGLAAFLLLLFDPNIMAHGRYTTTDIGGTLFLFLAAFLLWRCWQESRWRWQSVLIAALGLGLAFGSKLSTLGFVPILGLLALLPLYNQPWTVKAALQRLAKFLLAGLLSILVVWAIFGFQWGPFAFQSDPFTKLNSHSGPMPTFWAGIEQILTISSGGRPTFLLGQFSDNGFLSYFPIAFLVKTPLPILVLLLLAIILLLYKRETRKRAFFFVIPAVLYFLLSMQSALNIGYRHLLPMLPFLYLFISGLTITRLPLKNNELRITNNELRITNYELPITSQTVVTILLLFLIAANLWIYPNYLSYFNLAVGGPEKGGDILIDSNIDWGQDLLRLKDWMADNGVERVKLSWFGSADPAYYGINYEPLPGFPRHLDLWWDVPFNTANPEPGIYAISISDLWELPLEDKVVFPWFRAREPDDRVGYSILIYRVGEDETAQ
ncbi:MAG: phospholipid carrier-dependent glycosyltransferase [Candidatus Promineifilaceae bacterium]